MANKKKTASLSPIQQIIAYTSPKEDKSILLLPISVTENIDIEVKHLLDADEMISFVANITNTLILEDKYTPAIYNLVYAKAILAYYTNLKIAETNKSTPESASLISNEDLILLVFNTNIIEKIEEKINDRQLKDMIASVNKNIEFKKQEVLNSQSARLEKSIRQIELLTEATAKISEQFNDIDLSEMSSMLKKISNKSESEIASAVLDFQQNKL